MSSEDARDSYLAKAERALNEAKDLLDLGHTEGTCSRAYYAMFDAAHAALLIVGSPVTEPKTHEGLISSFGKYVVLEGHLERSFGRSINNIQTLRMVADYTAIPPDYDDAEEAVTQAAAFVAAVIALKPPTS